MDKNWEVCIGYMDHGRAFYVALRHRENEYDFEGFWVEVPDEASALEMAGEILRGERTHA